MRTVRAYPMLFSVMLVALSGAATAQDLPSYMAPIGGRTTSSAAETATKDVLALNTMMSNCMTRPARFSART